MKTKWAIILGLAFLLLVTGILLLVFLPKPDQANELPRTKVSPTESILPTDTPEVLDPLAGLIYKTDEALFQINNMGEDIQIADCSAELLSADLSSMFFVQDDDLWQLSLADCEAINVSNSPELRENNPQIWPTDPSKLFIGINPQMSAGAPAILDLISSEITYLDGPDGWTNSGVDPAPNGSQVAVRTNEGPAIYNASDGSLDPIDLSEFNIDINDYTRIEGPAWSPDGSKLAWVAGYQGQIGHLILDFSDHSYELLHLYSAIGRGGWPLPPVWSPDGQWLVIDVWAEDSHQTGFFIVSSDGSEEWYLGPNLTAPLWSPDSQILLYTSYEDGGGDISYSMENMTESDLAIPEGAITVAWPAP